MAKPETGKKRTNQPPPHPSRSSSCHLELLDTVTLLPPKPTVPTIRCRVCPNGRFFGVLAYKVLLRVYQTDGDRLRERYSYPLPPSAKDFALHPGGDMVAVATRRQVQLVDHRTDTLIARDLERSWGQARALLFSTDGEILWLSTETGRGKNRLVALRAKDLDALGKTTISGSYGAHHRLVPQPGHDVVAAEVSCGQAGTWVTFVHNRNGWLTTLEPGLDRADHPFHLAGFSPLGDAFFCVTQDSVDAWHWPDTHRLAQHRPDQTRWMLRWQGATVGPHVVVPVSDGEDERFKLLILDGPSLKLMADLRWQSGDQEYLVGVFAAKPDRLLVVGDLRAGLFRISQ